MSTPHNSRRLWGNRYTGRPFKVTGRAVVLLGGPRDGWAYWPANMERVNADLHAARAAGAYRPAGYAAVHPGSKPAALCDVWAWAPET